MHENRIMVRGYEMDSYGHVNNAVYLNYLEQSRWEVLRNIGLIARFKEEGLLLVVTELKIRYAREAKVFDELIIYTRMKLEGPYIIFKHRIENERSGEKLVTAEVKTLVINKDRVPCSVPQEFHKLFDN